MPILCSLFALAAPAAHAQKKPTVTQELERLQAEGVDPAAIGTYRATYTDARARVKRLTGARKVELGGVVTDLEGMAARRQLTASRLPSLFLTLQRNVEWWTTQRLLSSGERVGFGGSELVFQHYPGHGIQIQWLGTFGKLNGYWSGGKRFDARASSLLDEIKGLAAERAGGLAWEYLFPFDGQQPPWVSSLAQGTGLQAMARSATRLNRQADVFPVALAGLGIFKTEPPAGVRIPSGTGAHYLQYSGLPKFKVANGFIQSLNGLFDLAQLTGDPTAQSLFEDGDRAGRAEIATFDTGAWSLYSRGAPVTKESDLGYHKLLRDFLTQLCKRTTAVEYCAAEQHFSEYLATPPTLQSLTSTITARKAGNVRFKLDKISRVTLRITKGGKQIAVLSPGVLYRGTKSVRWTAPKESGDYDVTISATDLNNNAATTTGVITVKKRG
ncbi:hypothetical protein DVA67_019890 [Solirubrobacter sp. CPCC 204708]|uniref:D-glucuronyl C5-epimerase family protein n=1 Tax=Solirubrobacter deserti TaxID=2282478 RepID=A0ABT4RPV0_9ACTN|nr:D-glucuronyl C5-epimerase family protein [Solirubrobacter deserti]MBE2318254.1 hypothetical protein [Solirubrobacter deserti]MDA0140592.1 D-glucuronyl C5-epimerase family protein [Solirubrobacter deserti]